MEQLHTLARRVALLRKEHRLTQDQLAKKVGSSRTHLSNIENENRTPDIDLVIKIAKFFDVSVDHLLGEDNKTGMDLLIEENIIDESEARQLKRLIDDFLQLKPEDRRFTLSMLSHLAVRQQPPTSDTDNSAKFNKNRSA